tara:strand:+ start:699 stop:920 length:222 start_codon:yes stop_codon:yes gene_type:complete
MILLYIKCATLARAAALFLLTAKKPADTEADGDTGKKARAVALLLYNSRLRIVVIDVYTISHLASTTGAVWSH